MDISYRISIASRAACARSCLASFFEEARESDILRAGGGLDRMLIMEEPHFGLVQRHVIVRAYLNEAATIYSKHLEIHNLGTGARLVPTLPMFSP